MTRSDLIKTIAEKVDGVTQEKAKEIVAVTLDSIADALTAGDKVQFVGLEDFEVRERAGRTGGGTESGGDPAAVTQGTASDEMCTFLVVNISSLQLIPINMIAYRSQYGSAHPLAVAGPAFLATCISTLAGVAVCRVMCRRKQYKSIKKDGWK